MELAQCHRGRRNLGGDWQKWWLWHTKIRIVKVGEALENTVTRRPVFLRILSTFPALRCDPDGPFIPNRPPAESFGCSIWSPQWPSSLADLVFMTIHASGCSNQPHKPATSLLESSHQKKREKNGHSGNWTPPLGNQAYCRLDTESDFIEGKRKRP